MNGFLLLDKPEGFTSQDALNVLKRHLPRKTKIGHTGTLDPFATGLLVVGIGEALKFLQYLKEEPKVYEATLKLGEGTDTLDKTGQVISSASVPSLEISAVSSVLHGFLGEREQIPPMYSAKKIEGQRLYDLAREGQSVERKPQRIRIDSLDLMELKSPLVTFRAACSKGSYIRVLGEDVARALGTEGHLISLRRVAAGLFSVEKAIWPAEGIDLASHFISVEQALSHCQALSLSAEEAKHLRQGKRIQREAPEGSRPVTLFENETFIGMGMLEGDQLIPKRLMDTSQSLSKASSADVS